MSDKWAKYYKQTNLNLGDINDNLLKHMENLENENVNVIYLD